MATGDARARRRRAAVTLAGVLLATLVLLLTGAVALVRGPAAWTRPRPVALEAPDVARLRADVQLLAGELAPRSWADRPSLERAEAHVADAFADAGLDVELMEYSTPAGPFRNVLGRRAGTDPEAGLVVLTAHYDSPGRSPGADDNASSVAVLLELARTLPPEPGRRGLLLAATCTEEPPFFDSDSMGAHALARHLVEAGTPVHVMASLDCVGFYSDTPGSQAYPVPGLGLPYPSRGDFLAVVGDLGSGSSLRLVKRGLRAQRTLDVFSFRAPAAVPGVMLSDHLWFRRLGLPGVMVTDTAFLRNPHYHAPTDTPDTLDYDRLAAVVTGLHGVLGEAGAAP